MSDNALKRITIVMARGYGNRFDPNIQLSLHAIHELLDICFPNHDYGIKTVHLYLSRLFGEGAVQIVPGAERGFYRLTEHGFRQAKRHWTIRFIKLGYVEPKVPVAQSREVPSVALGQAVGELAAMASLGSGNRSEITPVT